MRTLMAIAILTSTLLVLPGCVQRTTYMHSGNVTSASGRTTDNRKPTSSKILWFWNKDFWSNQ